MASSTKQEVVQTVTIVHQESQQEWHVIKGQLLSCSPVFEAMLMSSFEESSSNIVIIDDFEPVAISQFVDLVEFPRKSSITFEVLAVRLRLTTQVFGLIDKYDATKALMPLIPQLVEFSPELSNIIIVDSMLMEHKWSLKVLQYIVKETMGYQANPNGNDQNNARYPATISHVHSSLSSSTLADLLNVINNTIFNPRIKNKCSFFDRADSKKLK